MNVLQLTKKAVQVLRHNDHGSSGLPRTAAWGYPEPYTRDLLLSGLGYLTSEDEQLIKSFENVLKRLAKNQSPLGQIPSLVDEKDNLGATDTTPLFLIAVHWYRKHSGDSKFLAEAAKKALSWLDHQRPNKDGLVIQLPTTDWRDEQWIMGHGLYVNMLAYMAYLYHGRIETAELMKKSSSHFSIEKSVPSSPYLSAWVYKVYRSDRFDLLGNSLAILSGYVGKKRGVEILDWVEKETNALKEQGLLKGNLPPNFFPYIQEGDDDWLPRYAKYNQAGDYHNGGIWPFINAFHIAAQVKCGMYSEAQSNLIELAETVTLAQNTELKSGFNEWYKAQTGEPKGNDWQTWSAALFLYAAKAVEKSEAMWF